MYVFSQITFSILGPLLTTFFVVAWLFVQPKSSGSAHVTWSWHKRGQGMNKLTSRQEIDVAALPSVIRR